MVPTPPPIRHVWYSPADCAAILDATPHGERWRAVCPVHGGDNPTALGIALGRDACGNPMTLLHCFAHVCPIEDICAAMGIQVRNLFCIHPDYAKSTRHLPRAHSPRIDRLKRRTEPASPDEIAQIMLEEMIVSDPEWIQKCEPARAKMWELAQASPKAHAALTRALHAAHLHPMRFWTTLAHEMQG